MKKKINYHISNIIFIVYITRITFYISSRFVIVEFIKISVYTYIHSYFGRTPRTVIYAGDEELHSIIVLIC